MTTTYLRALEHWLHGSLVALRGRLTGRRLEIAAGQGERALGRALLAQLRMRRRVRRDINQIQTRVRVHMRGLQPRRLHLRTRRI